MNIDHDHHHIKQLYMFNVLSIVASMIYSMFYPIFLYRNFFDVKILVIENLIFCINLWVGFVIGSFLLARIGYLKTLKIAFLIFALLALLTFLFADNIQTLYIVFAVLKGIAAGLVASVFDAFLLREVNKKSQKSYFFVYNALQLTFNSILPIVIAFLISYGGGYKITFILSFFIYFLIFVFPFNHNKIPKVTLSISDLLSLTKQASFKEFSFNKVVMNGADTLNNLIFAIVPFLILKNEFTLGLLTTLIAMFSAVLSLMDKNNKLRRQLSLAYFGSLIRVLVNTFFVIFFTTPILVIRGIAVSILTTFTDPVTGEMDIQNSENLLHHKIKPAIEMNIINETFSLTGKIIGLIAFLIVLNMFNDYQIVIIKILIVVYGGWKLANFFWLQRLNRIVGKEN